SASESHRTSGFDAWNSRLCRRRSPAKFVVWTCAGVRSNAGWINLAASTNSGKRISRIDVQPIALISTVSPGERAAAGDIVGQSPESANGLTVLFCCASYDLRKLGQALDARGRSRVIAAATSRAIGVNGFLSAGITGFHLPAGRFKVAEALIEDIRRFGLP